MHHAYSGEAFVKLRDPSGSIGGTIASDALVAFPALCSGVVLVLEHVAVVKTPQPHSMHHVCIVAKNIKHVVVSSEEDTTMRRSGQSSRRYAHDHPPPSPPQQQQQQLIENGPTSLQSIDLGSTFATQIHRQHQKQQQLQRPDAAPIDDGAAAAMTTAPSLYKTDTADDLLVGLDDDF